jgi:LmbE family N-acetylglucosaminyl deacetylase
MLGDSSRRGGKYVQCHLSLGVVAMLTASVAHSGSALAVEPPSGLAILEQLRCFNELGSVLHIAAHPDDENTQLITYLARGLHVRTAYLSITRGDGGQNLLGPEFGDELGLIRTHELLSARRLDGGLQFFTRGIDFGFSKDSEETLRTWGGQAVLSDVVRIIRSFQPDVIVTRFSPSPGRTHGHHTASAILAVAAFKAAADPAAFPEQLKDLAPWQAKSVVQSGGGGGSGVTLEITGNDPVLGEPFGTIASRSRAMHKSQGFGNFGGRGGGRGGVARTESFQHLAGEPAKSGIFDGIDTTWRRVPGGEAIGQSAAALIGKFDPQQPAASVTDLLSLRKQLAGLADSRLVSEKRRQLDAILQACLGLAVESTVANAEVVPGETLAVVHSASVRSDVPIRWTGIRFPSLSKEMSVAADLRTGKTEQVKSSVTIPRNAPLSQPYWLREPSEVGLHRVADASLIGQPENSPALPIEFVFDVGGQRLVVSDEPVAMMSHSGKPAVRRRLEIVAPVSLSFDCDVAKFVRERERPVRVHATAVRAAVGGHFKLEAPAGWKVAPPSQPFQLAAVGDTATATFMVTPPSQAESADLIARAEVNGTTFENRRKEIRYEHLPPLLLQPRARLHGMPIALEIRGKAVGYIPGAGDSVDQCLAEMGYTVKRLTAADLSPEGLQGLDAVVIGVRAFNVREDLGPKMPALFAFAEAGGNLIVQYNRPEGLKSNRFAPYDLRLSGDRVTDEESPVEFLAPDHPALNVPNKITRADFDGWVQERGIYFPNQWDEHFTPILEFKDRGESPLKSGILVAKHGKGHVVYTSLVWFRELPAGVPGAYRLFANLVSLGKQ